MTSICTNTIEQVYEKFCKEVGIPADKRPIINMKNEFLLRRLMLTSKKKMYASVVMMNEGDLFKEAKVDIKGLAIKKVNTNRSVRNKAEEILDKQILNSKKLNHPMIIKEVKRLGVEITNSLKNGELKYAIPGKVNDIETYEFPYRIQAVRATVVWNTLYPEFEIEIPNKIRLVKLKDIKGLRDILSYSENDEEKELLRSRFIKLFKNPNLFSGKPVDDSYNEFETIEDNKIDVIAIPENLQDVPKWIMEYIDIDTMNNVNLRPLLPILESVGFVTLPVRNNFYPSNFIKL